MGDTGQVKNTEALGVITSVCSEISDEQKLIEIPRMIEEIEKSRKRNYLSERIAAAQAAHDLAEKQLRELAVESEIFEDRVFALDLALLQARSRLDKVKFSKIRGEQEEFPEEFIE